MRTEIASGMVTLPITDQTALQLSADDWGNVQVLLDIV